MHSCSFRFDHIFNHHYHEFGHALFFLHGPPFFNFTLNLFLQPLQRWDPNIPGLNQSVNNERCVREWNEIQVRISRTVCISDARRENRPYLPWKPWVTCGLYNKNILMIVCDNHKQGILKGV
jgi:hypothetical protein